MHEESIDILELSCIVFGYNNNCEAQAKAARYSFCKLNKGHFHEGLEITITEIDIEAESKSSTKKYEL
jgi:hypothetical protein